MPRFSKRRSAVVALLAVVSVAVITAGIAWYLSADDSTSAKMQEYTPQRQQRAAEMLVDGLNSREPKNVPLMRNTSAVADADADNEQIDENITATMPPAGCTYVLTSVTDRGDQGVQKLPWFSAHETRRFDMSIRQVCPGKPDLAKTIGVLAIPSGMGGYWAEASFVP